jgi:hypothetical protein
MKEFASTRSSLSRSEAPSNFASGNKFGDEPLTGGGSGCCVNRPVSRTHSNDLCHSVC